MDLQTLGYLLFSAGVITVAGGFLVMALRPPSPPAADGRPDGDGRSETRRWSATRLP